MGSDKDLDVITSNHCAYSCNLIKRITKKSFKVPLLAQYKKIGLN